MKNMKNIFIYLFIGVIISGCASFLSSEGSRETRAVADYKALGQKIFVDTKSTITAICPDMKIEDCKKAKTIFNYTIDAYIIAGEFQKIIIDSDNSDIYIKNTIIKALEIKQKALKENNNEMIDIIEIISNIITTKESSTMKSLEIMQTINMKMLPMIAEILKPYVVEEN